MTRFSKTVALVAAILLAFVTQAAIPAMAAPIPPTIGVGNYPAGVAISPDGATAYIANNLSKSVSVVSTATNTVTATITVGTYPIGIKVSPDGSTVYVSNRGSNTVSVISTATNAVTNTIAVGSCW